MKQLLIVLLLCSGYFYSVSAQECSICGDWGGMYTDDNGRNIKTLINIKANGDEYIVRLKQVYCNGELKYDDFTGYTFRVSYSNSDSTYISWSRFEKEINQKGQNADGDDYDKTDVYKRYSLKIKGERMTFKSWHGYDRMYEASFEPGLYIRLCVDRENMITSTLYKGDEVSVFSEICQSENMLQKNAMDHGAAQDCPICGEWKGVYSKGGNNVKMVIRINTNGKDYVVRRKRIYSDGEIRYDDFSDFTFGVSSRSNNDSTIVYWNKLIWEENKIGSSSVCNGSIYDKTRVYDCYDVIIKGNTMTHHSWLGYDRLVEADNEPGTFGLLCSETESLEIFFLYKDDDDW